MSDDNPTRIIRPQQPAANTGDDATKRIGAGTASGNPFAGNQADDDEPKTRVISGFSQSQSDESVEEARADNYELAAGWLVVIDGPGKGCTREIYFGMNSMGRSSDERISLDFGDTAISRDAHAYVVFDEKQSDFYIQHGGKTNLVRLNGAPVLAPSPMSKGDVIEIGNTKLMFVPLCGEDFSWDKPLEDA